MCFSGRRVNETTRIRNRKRPRVSLKAAAMKHLCLPGSGKHTARHHSCKMSSGASSNVQRLTLIHKQLPLSVCRRFRTAVPPNISLSCLANVEKNKNSTSALSPQKKGRNKKQGEKPSPCKPKEEEKTKGNKSSRRREHAKFSLLYE